MFALYKRLAKPRSAPFRSRTNGPSVTRTRSWSILAIFAKDQLFNTDPYCSIAHARCPIPNTGSGRLHAPKGPIIQKERVLRQWSVICPGNETCEDGTLPDPPGTTTFALLTFYG